MHLLKMPLHVPVPALSIYPSGSRKAYYFRDDTVVEATDMVSRDSSSTLFCLTSPYRLMH